VHATGSSQGEKRKVRTKKKDEEENNRKDRPGGERRKKKSFAAPLTREKFSHPRYKKKEARRGKPPSDRHPEKGEVFVTSERQLRGKFKSPTGQKGGKRE